MTRPVIIIEETPSAFAAVIGLGNKIKIALTDNANFGTPSPDLTVLGSQISDATAALSAWGGKGNRGSHETYVDLCTKSLTLWQSLKAEAQYVQNVAQLTAGNDYELMAALIVTSGFSLKNSGSPQGLLQKVQDFRQVMSLQLNANNVLLKWKKPLNCTTRSNVKGYKVYKGVTPPVFSTAAVYATVPKCTFVNTNNTGDVQTWCYWIVPFNTAGDGVVSDTLVVTVLSM